MDYVQLLACQFESSLEFSPELQYFDDRVNCRTCDARCRLNEKYLTVAYRIS